MAPAAWITAGVVAARDTDGCLNDAEMRIRSAIPVVHKCAKV